MHPSIKPLFNQLARVQARALWGEIDRICCTVIEEVSGSSGVWSLHRSAGKLNRTYRQYKHRLLLPTHEESVTPYRNILVTLSLSMQSLSHPFPSSLPARYHVISKNSPTAVTS